ncbi:MAG: hypothetical protein EZS28_004125 [Streblomastix strix]|uniref:Uncharacterized protein n=1 Tax=Streblomastix strix TaxID=222440 RepID=A0A5J4X156_9EUKA|nr:MAG: hypothetical protein EZS28_004125 [Streblomastix strix]
MATQMASSDNIKHITLEKGTKRTYIRKSNEKITALTDQRIKEEIKEEVNKEPTIRYKNNLRELLGKHDEGTRLIREQEEVEVKQLIGALLPFVAKQMQEVINQPIIERVKYAMVDAVNYTKFECNEGVKRQYKTRKIIDLSLIEEDDLCVIDFEINKKTFK